MAGRDSHTAPWKRANEKTLEPVDLRPVPSTHLIRGLVKTRPQFTFSSIKQGQQPSRRVVVRIGNDAPETPLWDFPGSTVDKNLPANTGDVV